MAETIVLAAILGAHGVRGEVRLKLLTDSLDSLRRQKTLDAGGRMLTLVSARAQGNGIVARFAEVADRTAAEALRGTTLGIARDLLPKLDQQGEYYQADLIGLRVETETGETVGRVRAVENYGAGDILDIALNDGPTIMVPFREAVAPVVDIPGGRIVVIADALSTQ